MKILQKLLSLCCLCLVLSILPTAGATAKLQYTLPTKGTTVLQNAPLRNITSQTQPSRHELIPGESPTTGLPWEGDYLPMLVQIANTVSKEKINGKNMEAAGIGKVSPWGVQHADIVYETVLQGGFTRFTFLFSDCFAQGQPEKGVGPVRSGRIGQLLLREEWQSGFVYSGGYGGSYGWKDAKTAELLRQTGVGEKGVLFNMLSASHVEYRYRVKGVKAPSNLNADIIGLRALIPASFACKPRPFLFADESPYGNGYDLAHAIHLDWGASGTLSHFVYDKSTHEYLRYCGPGTKAAKWAPFSAFAAVDDRGDENRRQPAFANIIIQRVPYEHDPVFTLILNELSIGHGNADIFIGGRYIPGYWARPSLEEPTVFYDDQGREVQLLRGKTYIAHLPPEALCSYEAGEGS